MNASPSRYLLCYTRRRQKRGAHPSHLTASMSRYLLCFTRRRHHAGAISEPSDCESGSLSTYKLLICTNQGRTCSIQGRTQVRIRVMHMYDKGSGLTNVRFRLVHLVPYMVWLHVHAHGRVETCPSVRPCIGPFTTITTLIVRHNHALHYYGIDTLRLGFIPRSRRCAVYNRTFDFLLKVFCI